MKHCIDCRHFGANQPSPPPRVWRGQHIPFIPQPGASRECRHPRIKATVDVVHGTPTRSVEARAFVHRSTPWLFAVVFSRCGRSGRWFEPKEA